MFITTFGTYLFDFSNVNINIKDWLEKFQEKLLIDNNNDKTFKENYSKLDLPIVFNQEEKVFSVKFLVWEGMITF